MYMNTQPLAPQSCWEGLCHGLLRAVSRVPLVTYACTVLWERPLLPGKRTYDAGSSKTDSHRKITLSILPSSSTVARNTFCMVPASKAILPLVAQHALRHASCMYARDAHEPLERCPGKKGYSQLREKEHQTASPKHRSQAYRLTVSARVPDVQVRAPCELEDTQRLHPTGWREFLQQGAARRPVRPRAANEMSTKPGNHKMRAGGRQ